MFHLKINRLTLRLSGALLGLTLVFSACTTPTTIPTIVATTQPATAVPTPAPTATKAAPVNVSGVAQGFSSQVVEAVPAGKDAMWWAPMPQYTLLTLTGYPVANHPYQAQIFVFPVAELKVNENAAKQAEGLQALLQSQKVGESLPYLPLYNAKQVIHPLVKYLDFKNGKGVRFLTWYSQGLAPINNRELVYTFQGLTSDGKYYLAAVLPVTLPGLPADGTITAKMVEIINSGGYQKYLAETVSLLEQSPAGAYTPDLSKLDAMIQTMEIK